MEDFKYINENVCREKQKELMDLLNEYREKNALQRI